MEDEVSSRESSRKSSCSPQLSEITAERVGFEPEQYQTVTNDPTRLEKVDLTRPPAEFEAKCATARSADDSRDDSSTASASPRARLVAALTEAISAAVGAGDLHAARVAHEALGRLLAEPVPGAVAVADINEERGRRGQR